MTKLLQIERTGHDGNIEAMPGLEPVQKIFVLRPATKHNLRQIFLPQSSHHAGESIGRPKTQPGCRVDRNTATTGHPGLKSRVLPPTLRRLPIFRRDEDSRPAPSLGGTLVRDAARSLK